MQLDKYIYDNTYIYSLVTTIFMDQCILEQNKFSRLERIDCYGNSRITSMNHLANSLRVLDIGGEKCGVAQNGISELKVLRELLCDNNSNVYDVNHMSGTLEKLYCCGTSGITENGISNLKIKVLACSDNEKIKNVKGKKIFFPFNPRPLRWSRVNYLGNTLEELYCSVWYKENGVTQEGISELKKLQVLKCNDNCFVNNVKGKNLFSLQPSTIMVVSCKSFIKNIREINM